MSSRIGMALALLLYAAAALSDARECPRQGVQLQVLGSGGLHPEANRAGSGYLIWVDGRARVLVDVGYGVAQRLIQTGADLNDLHVVLLTHTHVDHTADLPALVQAALSGGRARRLPIHGPGGNRYAASTVAVVRTLFDATRGAWRHMGDVLNPLVPDAFKIVPHDVRVRARSLAARRHSDTLVTIAANGIDLTATPVVHGVYPALAWRVRIGNTSIVFTGDMNGEGEGFARLALEADLLVASHSILDGTGKVERFLHMPPSVIGRIAAAAAARELVLVHRGASTLGREEESLGHIRRHYANPVRFADDLSCFTPGAQLARSLPAGTSGRRSSPGDAM